MGARFCPNCGSAADVGATFCVRCGARLSPGVAPPPYAPPPGYAPPPPGYPYVAPPYPVAPYPAVDYAAAERKKGIDRTKIGVLLIFIGLLFNWVPYIAASVLSALSIVIGAILTVLGRKAFSDRHATFVVIAIIVFSVGATALATTLGSYTFQFLVAAEGGDLARAAAAVREIAIALPIGAAIIGIANVLFVHELVNKTGKYLLYAGYAAGVAVNGVLAGLAITQVANAVAAGDLAAVEGVLDQLTDLAPFEAVLTQLTALTALRLLGGVSSILLAAAYFIAYSRIQRGQIPPPVAPPAPAPGWAEPVPTPKPPPAPAPRPAAPPAVAKPTAVQSPPEKPSSGPEEL